MNRLLLLIIVTIMLQNCDKRACECLDHDMQLTSDIEDLHIETSNIVTEDCPDLEILISSKTEINVATLQIILSQNSAAFSDGTIAENFIATSGFVESVPAEFSHFRYILSYPIDSFRQQHSISSGEIDIEIAMSDDRGNTAKCQTTTDFYLCDDIETNFDQTNCRQGLESLAPAITYEIVDCFCR